MSSPVKTKRVAFDESTAVPHIAIAGVAGQTIMVKELFLISAGAVELTVRSGSTDLAGFPLNTDVQVDLGMIEGSDRHFETADGEDFILDLDGAVRVSGFLVYEQS